MIRQMMTWAKHHKWFFAAALLLSVATVLAGMGLMSTAGYLISRAALRPLITDLFMVTAAVRFFGISRAVVRYFERLLSHDFTFRILGTIRTTLYRAIDTRPLQWMMGHRPGDLLGRLVADVEMLQNAYLRIIIPVITAYVIAASTTWLLWMFDPLMALVSLAFLLGPGLAIPLLAIWLARGSGQVETETRAAMKVFLVDRIQGMQDVLWLGQEREMRRQFTERQQELDRLLCRHAGRSGLLEGLNTTLAHGGAFATLLLAIPMVMAGELKVVMLATLTLGVLSSFEAAQGLGHAFLQYGHAAASAKRVFTITEAQSEDGVGGRPGADVPDSFDIVFNKVSFAYEPGAIILSDVSLQIPEGTKLAIIGPTGSGKTTLANLLLRFYDVDRGSISLGGVDIRQWDAEVLRSQFSVVSQDAYIFQRSLRENLLLARPAASESELADVLNTVGLGDFSGLLDMVPGSHGMRLSGGERQLFFLTQVLLKNAPVWIFDELTAHLDVQTERKVLDTIWSHLGDRTCIFITHRLVDIDKMDQIIVMDRGRIVEQGTHADLIKMGSFYERMCHHQQQVLNC